MRAIIYFSTSRQQNSKRIAMEYEGDHYRIDYVGKHYRSFVMQLIYFGFKLAKKKPIEYTADSIDFDSYDELVFVSPVWGGKLNPYMKKFIEDHPIKNKKIKVIGASKGDNPGYVSSCEGVFDTTNQIQSISMRLPK